jgi:hypothetical protein
MDSEIKSDRFFKIDDKRAILSCLFLTKASLKPEALEQLKKEGTNAILDVRQSGGLLNEAVNICNLF